MPTPEEELRELDESVDWNMDHIEWVQSDSYRNLIENLARISRRIGTAESGLSQLRSSLRSFNHPSPDSLTGEDMPRHRSTDAPIEAAESQLSLIPTQRPEGELAVVDGYEIRMPEYSLQIDPDFEASIQRFGILSPVTLVRLDQDSRDYRNGYRYRVVAGRRRIDAALANGQQNIPALIYPAGTTPDVVVSATIIENNMRDTNVASDFYAVRELMQRGFSEETIAHDLGLSPATVRARSRLINLHSGLLHYFTEGKMSASIADRLARMEYHQQDAVYRQYEETFNTWDGRGQSPRLTQQLIRDVLGAAVEAAEQLDVALDQTAGADNVRAATLPQVIDTNAAIVTLAGTALGGVRVDTIRFASEDGRVEHTIRCRTPISVGYVSSNTTSQARAARVCENLGGTRDPARIMPQAPPAGASYYLARPMQSNPHGGLEVGAAFNVRYLTEQYVSNLLAESEQRARVAAVEEYRARQPRALPTPAVIPEGAQTREQVVAILTDNGTYGDVDTLLEAAERAIPASLSDDADRIQEAITMVRAMLVRAEV